MRFLVKRALRPLFIIFFKCVIGVGGSVLRVIYFKNCITVSRKIFFEIISKNFFPEPLFPYISENLRAFQPKFLILF